MSRSNEDPRGLVLHVVVVGFHHKKGCQVEFSYPPLVPGESHDSKKLPEEWKYLPFLALPDGAHNYQEDVIYFLLPARQGEKKCVYAVSCYKQIEAKALKVREADVTRDMVQKSVCVLSSEPFFGLLQAKLKLITHAYFEEKDFSQISILKELYEHVNSSLNGSILDGSPAYLGISSRDLVLKFKQKVLVLFKLILLEKKVLFIGSPVEKLVSPMMSLLSLFPGIIEYGLAKASGYRPRLSVSTNSRQHSTDNTSPPVPVTNGSNESPGSEASVSSSDGRTDSAELLQPPGSGGTGRLRISLASSESDWETLEPGMLEIESAGGTTGPPTPEGALEDDAVDVETDVVKQEEEVNRSAEMLSGLEENDHGMPLAIFTKGYLFMPYMALQQHHLLADVSIRGFLAGATNIIFRQQRHLSDVIVDVATAQLEVQDPELRRILELSTADLRFTDWLLRHVSEPASEDLFLNGTDWEGGDEWVRAQFALYMDSLLASTLQPDNERIIADFGIGFMSMWQNTHNYRVWHGREHPGMAEVAEGHPFQGQYSVSDVKLRLAHSVQNSERGKKIGNAVLTTGRSMVQTSKAVGHSVGGALQNARSAVSTWFSGLTQPGTAPDPPGTAPDPPGTAPDPPGTAPDPPGVAPDPPGAEKS